MVLGFIIEALCHIVCRSGAVA